MADDVIDALAKLKPATPDRAAMLFAAGRASARRGPWRLLLVGLVVQQAILISIWTARKEPEKIVYAHAEAIGHPTPDDSHPAMPELSPTPPQAPASLRDLDPHISEPVPSASTLPEQHWTVRTAFTDL